VTFFHLVWSKKCIIIDFNETNNTGVMLAVDDTDADDDDDDDDDRLRRKQKLTRKGNEERRSEDGRVLEVNNDQAKKSLLIL